MEMTPENETKSDKSGFEFKVFGTLGTADGNAMIDVAMQQYVLARESDRPTVQLMIDRGSDMYYKNLDLKMKLEKGDIILTPAGMFTISNRGSETLVKAFTKILDEERQYGDLKSLSEKIRNEFFYILGYFSILWELEEVFGSKVVEWSEDKTNTTRLIQKSIRFVGILLQEIESGIREDLR